MASGLKVWDENGKLIFTLDTNAGRGCKILTVTGSGSVTDDLLLQGVPYWAWMNQFMEIPRSCTISVVGNVLSYTLSAAPIANPTDAPVIICYGVK